MRVKRDFMLAPARGARPPAKGMRAGRPKQVPRAPQTAQLRPTMDHTFTTPGRSMSLLNIITKQLIEVIEWTDDSRDTLSYRWPDEDKEIKNGAQLVVCQLCTVVPSISDASRSSTCTVIVFVFAAICMFFPLGWRARSARPTVMDASH